MEAVSGMQSPVRVTHPALSQSSQHLNAVANLMKEQRLSTKENRLHKIGEMAQQYEHKLPMTEESLHILGAGKPYGGR